MDCGQARPMGLFITYVETSPAHRERRGILHISRTEGGNDFLVPHPHTEEDLQVSEELVWTAASSVGAVVSVSVSCMSPRVH